MPVTSLPFKLFSKTFDGLHQLIFHLDLDFLSSVICMFVPIKVCFFPLVIFISPKCVFIVSKSSSMTLESTCDALFSSTYHATVHCFPLMFLFATHLSYLFNIYPSAFKVCVYKLYCCSDDSIQPYITLSTFKYKTFFPCSYLTYCPYSPFMSHTMSTRCPRSFRITFYLLASRSASTLL